MTAGATTTADLTCDQRTAEQPGHALELHGVQHLLEAVERQSASEASALAAYRHLAANPDPVVALVAGLAVEDEVRHQALTSRLAATLRDALQWTRSPEALPADGVDATTAAETLVSLRTLVQQEHRAAAELRRLASPDVRRFDALLSVLFDAMAADGEKHEHLLRFLVHRLEAAHPSPPEFLDEGEES